MTKYILMALAGAAMLTVSACSVLGGITPDNGSARLAVVYGSLKYIDGDAAKADRVLYHAKRIENAVDSGQLVTVAAVDTALRAQIEWQALDPADQLLLDALLNELRLSLEEHLDQREREAQVYLLTIARWVQEAAALAGGGRA